MAALLPDTRRALRHRLATGQVQGRAPSVVGAVVRDGRPVWADGYGSVDGRPTRLRPTGDGGWRGLNGYYAGELLQVKRDAGGAVTHLDLGTFVFTRQPYEPADVVPGGVDPAGWRTIR